MHRSVIIIGAGLSGLIAAKSLQSRGWLVEVLENRGCVGGRIQTDLMDGFLLDHGFQVFLTAYEQASQALDCAKLELGNFSSGALVYCKGKFIRVADPWRSPEHLLATAIAPIGSLFDKLRIARFRRRVTRSTDHELLQESQTSALERLRFDGFSEKIISCFFRPFFGGIFLEQNLETSSGRMDFVFRNFSLGMAALPRNGMQAIPAQLAERLNSGTIKFNTTVATIASPPVNTQGKQVVVLSDGTRLNADIVIVATEKPAANKLLGIDKDSDSCSTTCTYFAVKSPPLKEATLVLNGELAGPINSLCFPSFAQPSYAPQGQHLLSVTTRGNLDWAPQSVLDSTVMQLRQWFGPQVDQWKFLRTYRIVHALPAQKPSDITPTVASSNGTEQSLLVRKGVYRCGDYCETASIEGAIKSGLKVAEEVLSKHQSSTD